jgi:polar amino acid transport system substrate-binding protein
MIRAFSSESLPRTRSGVQTGSRQENASNEESRARFRFYRNGKGYSARAERRGDRRATAWKPRYRLARYAASICLLLLGSAAADARSLEIITERGALTLCANPNALPFASKTGPVPGFQIELGEKIAQQLGVKLTREWVISAIQYRRADCDLVLDSIARKDTPPAGGVQVSRPYHRSGVVLAVRADSRASSLASLGSDQRVGVPVGSLVSMTLDKGGTVTSPFVFEDDIVTALANREIEAAAVTPATVGWFNQQHADKPLRLIPAFDNDPDLNWNIAAGLFRPDDKLRQRVDAAIEALLADGTIARIYARYGIELRPPQ